MAKAQKTTGLQKPANLSFLRSLEPTVGAMSAVKFAGAQNLRAVFEDETSVIVVPVEVSATTIRGTIANDSKEAPEKRVGTGEKAINGANIALIEQALLPVDAAHLLVRAVVRFSGHAANPAMCSSPAFQVALKGFVAAYAERGGFEELALRYVLNIANGSWLWRNRFGQELETRIALGETALYFSERDIDMSHGFSLAAVLDEDKRAALGEIVKQVALALAGGAALALDIAGLVRMGEGAEVYPSQEFASDATEKAVKGREADKLTKVLSKQRATDGRWVATMHARKIGNALRTIDTWHGVESVGAIAVEPYGANTHQGEAHRIKGNDLYSSLSQPERLLASLDQGLTGEHHFVVACLVRGGVFGFADAAKDKSAKAKDEASDDVQE